MEKLTAELAIAQIYSAASGRISWEQPLASMCQLLQAWAIQIVAFDKTTGGIAFGHIGGGAALIDHLAYIRTYNRIDPRPPVLLTATTGGWLHCHQVISEEMVARDPFYQEFLIPAGGRYASGTKLVEDDHLSIVMGVHRGIESQPLNADDIAFFETFRSHLIEAMAIYRYLAAQHYESAMGYAILDGLHHPTLLIDSNRSIRFANIAAKNILASKRGVSDHRGVLRCNHVDDNNNLVAELIDLLHDSGERANSNRRYFRLHDAASLAPVGVCLSALRPKEVMAAFGNMPLVMVVFHDTNNTAKPDPFLLAEVFDLTPAEVQVATAIAEGRSLESIAQRRNVAVGTVREQLKTLFSKTQTNRQSDLVRRLMALSPIG